MPQYSLGSAGVERYNFNETREAVEVGGVVRKNAGYAIGEGRGDNVGVVDLLSRKRDFLKQRLGGPY